MKKKTGMIYRDPVVSALSEKKEKYVAKVSELNSVFYKGVVNGLDTAMKIVARQKDVLIGNGTSDGAHTFGELYKQRAVMLSVVASLFPDHAWKTRLDHKGEAKMNRFIVGFDTPAGQSTFHCDIQKFWDKFDCPEIPQCKPFDGHTSGDAVKRLESMKCVAPSFHLADVLNLIKGNGQTVCVEVYLNGQCYPCDIYRLTKKFLTDANKIPSPVLLLPVSGMILTDREELLIQVTEEASENE